MKWNQITVDSYKNENGWQIEKFIFGGQQMHVNIPPERPYWVLDVPFDNYRIICPAGAMVNEKLLEEKDLVIADWLSKLARNEK
ncbi:MAG TPA: hypothetical protein PLK06_03940 [bacterium]|nr:hypothetical protein [bacterium]